MVRVVSPPARAAGLLLLCLATLPGRATPAAAADRAAAPAPVPGPQLPASAFAWTGPYAGLFAGYAGGALATDEVNGPRRYQGDSHGFVGGGVVGYQVSMRHYVFGLEAELGHLGAEASVSRAVSGGTVDFDSRVGVYGALAARGGYLVMPDLLVFGRAGVVAAQNDTATTQRCDAAPYCGGAQSEAERRAKADGVTWGGLVGLGAEKAFAGGWSARFDYTYFRFREELALPPTDGPGWRSDADAHTLRVGVSRRF